MVVVTATRSHSPLSGKNDSTPHVNNNSNSGNVQSTTNRRIGSGRILRDSSWDFDKQENNDNDYNFRPQQQRNDIQDNRRSFGRDFDKEKDNRRRYNDRRRISSGNFNTYIVFYYSI